MAQTAAAANPYDIPLRAGFTQWVLLNGVMFQFENHYKHRVAEIERDLKSQRRPTRWFAAASLLIEDPTFWPVDRWARPFPIGGHFKKGRRFLTALHESMAREAAWTVAQAFEAFETFLKDFSALYLKRNPTQLSTAVWTKRRRKTAPVKPRTRHLRDYREFVRSEFRGADDLAKRLRQSVSGIALGEQKDMNVYLLDFVEWFAVVTEVRHAVVHAAGVMSALQLKRLGPARTRLLRKHFAGRQTASGYRLTFDAKDARKAVETFAAYALLIYKETSLRETLDPESFKRRGGIRLF
jgi:hypothetical protein